MAGTTGIQGVEGRGAAAQPIARRTAPQQRITWPKISVALSWEALVWMARSQNMETMLLLLTIPLIVPAMALGSEWHRVGMFVE